MNTGDRQLGDRQREWLKVLNYSLPSNVALQVCYEVYKKRLRLPEVFVYPVKHRVILPFEIVLEFDRPEYSENRELTDLTLSLLKELEIPYLLGYSGNKSFHVHVFYKYDLAISEERDKKLKEQGFTALDLRNKIAEKYITPVIEKAEKTIFGESYLDMSNFNRNSLIREFGGRHDKTGFYKTYLEELPEERPQATAETCRFPERVEFWQCKDLLEKNLRYWRPRKKEKRWRVFSHGKTS